MDNGNVATRGMPVIEKIISGKKIICPAQSFYQRKF